MQFDAALDRKARDIVTRVVLPGEWYLVRWGGTRKGSGTFYTRPQLAVPTVHRTLRPLAYDPPMGKDDKPNVDAPLEKWTPKKPEEILKLKVCDPACGSGSFSLAGLRFLSQALLSSLRHHGRIHDHAGRAVIDLIKAENNGHFLASEALPCRPEDDDFELRTKAILAPLHCRTLHLWRRSRSLGRRTMSAQLVDRDTRPAIADDVPRAQSQVRQFVGRGLV